MKKIMIYALAFLTAITLVACGGNKQEEKKVKFNPKERTSSLSDSERSAAIEAKRRALLPIDMDSLIASHGVKFSVLPPAITENVPQVASDKMGSKLIQIASKNGICGLCTNPVLAMVVRVDCVDRSMTGTAPQKAIVKYEVTVYCGNFLTNDIYASASQTITGVGQNLEDAASKAMNELKDTRELQQMMQTASKRALEWYNAASDVKNYVDKAISEKEYGAAMALLSSVPQQSTTYDWAMKRNEEVINMYFQEKARELLGALEGAIAEAGDDYTPEIGAYLQLIPERSTSYKRAKELYDNYIKRVRFVRDDIREKEHRLAMEKLEVTKIRAPYEAEEAIARIIANARVDAAKASNTGGFLGLGKFWDGTFSFANKLFDKFL